MFAAIKGREAIVELLHPKRGLDALGLEGKCSLCGLQGTLVADRRQVIKHTGWVVSRGALMLCLGFFGSAGLSDAPTAKEALPKVPAQAEPLETTVILSFPDLREPGSARQLQRTKMQARSLYADGESLVTASQIRDFLSRHNSPMAAHAEEIVFAGNRYGIDPRMIVAIAGVESQYGKRCRGFNAWGWHGGRTRWSSWSESIDLYSASMRSNYPNWRNIQRLAPRYNPNTPEAWGRKVAFLMDSIQSAA